MASAEKASGGGGFLQNLLSVGLYKRTQGRITRQVTFFAIVVGLGTGAYRMNELANANDVTFRWIIPGLMITLGMWIAYRLVNMPSFADFLIAVEAEMSKVSWPTRTELVRGSVVVLLTIIILAAVLYLFDFLWTIVFHNLLHLIG